MRFRPLKVLYPRSRSHRPNSSGPINFCLTFFISDPHLAQQYLVVRNSLTVTTLKNFVADLSILLFGAPPFPQFAPPYFQERTLLQRETALVPVGQAGPKPITIHDRLWMR